ncbi:MAG: hypothetical protein Q7I98_04955 [Erysipelotrichaceae bacterium]|nr:hypothetical protein [Erysipelotrichaceae bacterium]
MSQPVSKTIYWAPRILSILLIAFLTLFSLDVFESASSTREILTGLFIHNLPSIILIIVLIIAWKYEIVGAIAFILAGLFYIALNIRNAVPLPMALTWRLTLSGPAFLIGILFLMNWRNKKGTHRHTTS